MFKHLLKMRYMQTKALDTVVFRFPEAYSFAFTYGSSAFPQSREPNTEKKMVDLVFVVDDALTFHRENLKCNPSHYSFLKYGGAQLVCEIQENFGAKVYFNTLVEVENTIVKYGVISTHHLVEDLLDWQTLYISGRLQKPVKVIKTPKSEDMIRALNTNLQSAIHASLLCLPETFSEEELFSRIVSLSYNGDFRMYFGEDKKKVQNIVQNQMEYFRKLYEGHINLMPHLYWKQSDGKLEQDCGTETTLYHLNLLPKKVQHNILISFCKDGRYRDIEDVFQALAFHAECGDIVRKAIDNIVWWPSINQSLKGLFTAGGIKSLKYSSSKIKKMVKSLVV